MVVLGVNYQGEDDGEVITKRFLPGGTDVFRISAGDVGELVKIRVIVDPTGKNPNWLLNKVQCKCRVDDDITNGMYMTVVLMYMDRYRQLCCRSS